MGSEAASPVLRPQDVETSAVRSVGAKALTLARIAREAIPVPAFFVVPSGAFALHLAGAGIAWPRPGAPASADPESVRERIRQAPVPDAVAAPVLAAYRALSAASGHGTVAVRSSAAEEDAASASFAGQFTTALGVEGPEALLDALRDCWASSLSDRSLAYRSGRGAGLGAEAAFAVIVQVQVFAEKAGVLFTVHPLEAGGRMSYIEANFGTGESVTGGLVTPDGVIVSRTSGEVVATSIGPKRRMTAVAAGGSRVVDVEESRRHTPVLTDAEAQAVARTGLRLEQLLGPPQDVEWAFDAEGLWILQSRPVTVG